MKHLEYVHNKHSGEVFSCKICHQQLSGKTKLSSHMKLHEEKVQCEICELLISQSGLTKHKIRRHGNMAQQKQILPKNEKCELCDKTFATIKSLKMHTIVHSVRTKDFKCNTCENRFISQSSLKSHMITHTSEKPFQCGECPKSFNNGGSLSKHKDSQHRELRFNCDQCSFKAVQKATLVMHKESVHEGLKFQCDQCDHKVSWKGDLSKHRKKMHTVFFLSQNTK